MLSAKTDGHGVRVQDRGNKPLGQEVVGLLKTQDLGYVRTALARTRKERERLEGTWDFQGDKLTTLNGRAESGSGNHTIFVDTKDEQDGYELKDQRDLKNERFGRTQSQQQEPKEWSEHEEDAESSTEIDEELPTLDRTQRRIIARSKDGRAKYLEMLKKREKDLLAAEEELDSQRAKMNGTATVGITKTGQKFKIRQRKR
jgi:U3 small nucleolar RNA-associated protein 11